MMKYYEIHALDSVNPCYFHIYPKSHVFFMCKIAAVISKRSAHLPLCEPIHMVACTLLILSTSSCTMSPPCGPALIPSLTRLVGSFMRRCFSLVDGIGVDVPDEAGEPVARMMRGVSDVSDQVQIFEKNE